MTLTTHKSVFGIHSVCAYNPESLVPYGIAKVIGSLTLNLTGENIPLNGGSSLYPFAVEKGVIETTGSLSIREVADWMHEAFQGSAATINSAETGGATTTMVNANGTSLLNATTGIASVGVKSGSEADVKSGMFMVKVVSSTTVDVYAMTDVDFLRGTDLIYQNDALKITASALTVATGAAVTIPNLGLELTGGSGTIGMTIGDTAWFDARSINTGSADVTVGATGETIPDVGLMCAAQKKGNGEVFFLDIMRASASGFPYNFAEKAWMEGEVPFTAYRDSIRNGVYRFMHVDGT